MATPFVRGIHQMQITQHSLVVAGRTGGGRSDRIRRGLHRRNHAILPEDHLMGDGAGCSLLGSNEDDGAGDEIVFGCRSDGHDRRAVRDSDFLFFAMVGHGDSPAINVFDGVRDGRVGHAAIGFKIPPIAALACAFHGRREDEHFKRTITTACLWQRCDSDEIARLDVGNLCVCDAGKFPVVSKGDIDGIAFARLYFQDGSAIADNPAPDMDLREFFVLLIFFHHKN
jgi:hypothetical protein